MGKKNKRCRAAQGHRTAAPAGPTETSGWGVGQRLGGDAPASVTPHIDEARVPISGGPLLPAGLRRVREAGDGNCLFHAIARQALDDPLLCGRARNEICDWMQAHLLPSVVVAGQSPLSAAHQRLIETQLGDIFRIGRRDGDSTMLGYVRRMRQEGEWGTGLEALCAAYWFRRPVHVWGRDGNVSRLQPPAAVLDTNLDPIRVLHNGRNHWDSASPIGPSPVEDIEDDDDSIAIALAVSASILNDSTALPPQNNVVNQGELQKPPAISAAMPHSSDELGDVRALQRALAAEAASARQVRENVRGITCATRAIELRQSQEKSILLGRLAECCARSGDELPLGAGLASLAQLRKFVDARALMVIDREGLSWPSPSENRQVSDSSASAPATLKQSCSTSCGYRLRDPSQSHTGREITSSTAYHSEESLEAPPTLHLRLMEKTLEECIVVLRQLGFCYEEAANILECCDCDVERVKTLYGIDWDHDTTVQTFFPDTC